MVQHLFPRFLDDPSEYARAEAYWSDLWNELARFTGQQEDWQYPWLATAYANGTPFRDGDPIFSAWSPSRMLGVRVIQHEPGGQGMELGTWPDVVGDQWSGEVRTLVISCALSKQAADQARSLLLSWMRYGKVSVCHPPEGPPLVAPPRESWPLKLRPAAQTQEPKLVRGAVPA